MNPRKNMNVFKLNDEDMIKDYLLVTDKNNAKFKYTGESVKVNSISCAVFDLNGEKFAQPWMWCKPFKKGEKHINAKLTNKDVIAICKEGYTTNISVADLAKKYDISEGHCYSLLNGLSWRHITYNLIRELVFGKVINKKVERVISASNKDKKKNTKISASIAKFIVRDHLVNKVSLNKLCEKYYLSKSSIRRIITGKAWKQVTVDAIKEFQVFK